MIKSRLRRLAGEYARGRLERDEYLHQRGELINGIVAGETAIRSSAQSMAEFATARFRDRGFPGTRLLLIIGAGVVIAVIWAFLASRETTPPGAGDQNAGEQVPEKRQSAARMLVEGFLSTRDWPGESLAEFRDEWNALTPDEQAEARAAAWFNRLAEALRVKISAHMALAEFDSSGRSTATGKRLAGFGEILGIDSKMPDLSLPGHHPIPANSDLREELRGTQGDGSALNTDPATMPEEVAKPRPRETAESP